MPADQLFQQQAVYFQGEWTVFIYLYIIVCMFLTSKIEKDNLFHAYCLVGDCSEIKNNLLVFFQKEMNFKTSGNPDFWSGDFDVFGVDDSRIIKERQLQKPTVYDKKIIVISANFVTEQAQNAMLKLFEEPIESTHLFLISPSSKNFIKTFKSRVVFLDSLVEEKSDLSEAKSFLKASLRERLDFIKELIEKISDEKESKIRVVNLLGLIEKLLLSKSDVKESVFLLEEIEKARIYAGEQSPSLKMLLEHIALILPVQK